MTTTTVTVQDLYRIDIGKTGADVQVDVLKLPDNSREHIFLYGLRQILNDARASAKNDAEAVELTKKRLDNLMSGTLRASPNRIGDPVKAEAMRIAIGKVKAAPAFKRWLAENDLKPADKTAVDKLRELATPLAQREDIVAIAESNVAAVKELDDIELDL